MVPTLTPMALHEQKSDFAFHLNCLDLRKIMVSLMMLSALCAANTSANYVTGTKKVILGQILFILA